jgi:predicted glycosyltransferase
MPESPVDSYRLIKTSDLVVTCGSTIAMEAGYLGAPVLSIGSGIYDYLHAVKKITDPNQWDLILKNKDFHELKANIAACENYAFFEKKREIERLYDFEEYPGKISSLPNLFIRVVSYIYRYSQQKQKGFTLWMNH